MEIKSSPALLYEDEQIVVLDKPAGLASEGGLPAALRALWNAPEGYVGIVHRLDTGVSGLMVCAKTPAAAAALSRQIQQGRFRKEYRAVIAGGPEEALPESGQLRDYLFKDSRAGRVYPVKRLRKGVREAVLDYQILQTAETPDGLLSLVQIRLQTGRTHQIRVQFSSRRHPLWGDGKYGSRYKGPIALQSAKLEFDHPETGKKMSFTLPLPKAQPWELFQP